MQYSFEKRPRGNVDEYKRWYVLVTETGPSNEGLRGMGGVRVGLGEGGSAMRSNEQEYANYINKN